jgi:hypothetical protein
MQIDNIDETVDLLNNIEYLFMNLEDVKKNLEKEINIKDLMTEDYLHELELAKLNGIEIMRTSNQLIKTRKDRRVLKDKLDLIKTIKGYTDKYITKGIVADTTQVIQNIETLKNNINAREYTPRVVQNLKCAKRGKNEN